MKNWNIRSEDFLRCLRLGRDALPLPSACIVIFVKVLSPCLGLESAYIRPKHRLKAAICLAESFTRHHVALAARDIRKDREHRTLNRFPGLPVQKHMVLLGHEISHHIPTITRPPYNLGGKTTKQAQFCVIPGSNSALDVFSVIVYYKYPFQIFFNWKLKLATGIHTWLQTVMM